MKIKNDKNGNENQNNFSFFFYFVFHVCFCFSFKKPFAFLLTPRGVEVLPSLDWPRSAIAFLLIPRGVEVPQTVNCLLLSQEVPQHFRFRILPVAQWCHRWSTLSSLAQKCHRTQKYDIQPYSNMQNSMMLFTFFFVFNRKHTFWANFGRENQTCQSKVKFGCQSNSNMQNSVMLFTFSSF